MKKTAHVSGFKRASLALVGDLAEAVADLARDFDNDAKGQKVRSIMAAQNLADAGCEHPGLDDSKSIQASVFRGRLLATRARRRMIEGGSAADAVFALPAIAAKVNAMRDEERVLTATIRAIESEALSQGPGAPDASWLLPKSR